MFSFLYWHFIRTINTKNKKKYFCICVLALQNVTPTRSAVFNINILQKRDPVKSQDLPNPINNSLVDDNGDIVPAIADCQKSSWIDLIEKIVLKRPYMLTP